MAVTINASTSAGLVQTADTTGNLSLQSNGTTIAALTSTGLAVTGAGSFSTTLGVTGQTNVATSSGFLYVRQSAQITGAMIEAQQTAGLFGLGINGAAGEDAVVYLRINGGGSGGIIASNGNLVFKPGNTAAMTLASAGAVTIPGTLGVTGATAIGGTAVSTEILYLEKSTTAFLQRNYASNASPQGILQYYSAAAPNNTANPFFQGQDTGATRIELRSNGGIGNFSANNVNLSDANVKSRIEPIGTQWDAWKKIEWMKFKYDDQTHDDWNYGYTAQNIESIYPELVDAWEPKKGETSLKAVYSEDLKNITGSVLQEAQLRIEQLEARLAALEAK